MKFLATISCISIVWLGVPGLANPNNVNTAETQAVTSTSQTDASGVLLVPTCPPWLGWLCGPR